jgi:hypothetical protein
MRLMRLCYVDTVGFRASEQTNYEALVKRLPQAADLGPTDVVLFVSAGGNQLLFVHGFQKLSRGKETFECLRSERLRLRYFRGPAVNGRTTVGHGNIKAVWDPLMVADYARAVGIKLINLKLWKEHKREMIARLLTVFAETDREIEATRAKLSRRRAS